MTDLKKKISNDSMHSLVFIQIVTKWRPGEKVSKVVHFHLGLVSTLRPSGNNLLAYSIK